MEILLKRKLAKVRRVNGSITVCGKVQTVWQKAVDRGSRRSMPTAVTKLLVVFMGLSNQGVSGQ